MQYQTDSKRETALQILKEVNHDKKYSNISLKANLKNNSYDKRDAAFVTQLVYGTLEKQITLDWVMRKFATIKRINPWVENILRMGAYQILYMDRVPDSAACNESVKLCKKHGLASLSGFVNGVLRNISRNKKSISYPDKAHDPISYLSLTYSYPLWLVEKWVNKYGISSTESILASPEENEWTTIRINLMKTTKQDFCDKLTNLNIPFKDGLYFEEALRIQNIESIDENLLFKQGLFTIQSESSMLVSRIIDPQYGETILDACSAPGGKAVYMAEIMKNTGTILAWDIHPHRVNLIHLNAERMGVENIKPMTHNAQEFLPELKHNFDKVLIDAPCSGLGVVHKKPDIKLNLQPEQLSILQKVQWNILTTCSQYVKPGGTLVYSTCTINHDENENMIMRFLENHSDYTMDILSVHMPSPLRGLITNEGMIQLIPSRDGTEGFFISKLRRKN